MTTEYWILIGLAGFGALGIFLNEKLEAYWPVDDRLFEACAWVTGAAVAATCLVLTIGFDVALQPANSSATAGIMCAVATFGLWVSITAALTLAVFIAMAICAGLLFVAWGFVRLFVPRKHVEQPS